MSTVEIEVRARTVDLAVEAAMQELGVDDREQLAVEVISEPVKGFLGLGGQDAVVRVKKRPATKRRGGRGKTQKPERKSPEQRSKSGNGRRGSSKSGKNGPRQKGKTSGSSAGAAGKHERKEKKVSDDRPILPVEEQAEIARDFLEGLVEAFNLEGEVNAKVEDDVIVADVSGEQTEALVGVRGTVRSAIHELTRTVLQRHAQDTARLRLDIAGYAERRRQALSIYAEQLMDQLEAEGGEIMLEPMSPADRKVIHDVAASREGVTSYSEGEAPKRYVVLSKAPVDEEE